MLRHTMTDPGPDAAKLLLDRWRGGDLVARDRLFHLLYPDIERAAAALLRLDRGASFSARDLVHEVMMRLIRLDQIAWADRSHFLALASRMMRRTLIDHVRRKRAARRDHVRVQLETGIDGAVFELDEIDFAIDRLGAIDPVYAEIVEMRYFGGMSLIEIGEVLNCSESTVKRRWRVARAWLLDWMSGETASASSAA